MNKIKIIFFTFTIFLSYKLNGQSLIEIKSYEDAVNYALHHNKSLLISRELAAVNFYAAKKDFGDFFPKLIFSFSDSSAINKNSSDYKGKSLNFGFSWLIFDGGQKKNGFQLKQYEALFARLSNEENVENHCLKIMESFFNYQIELQKKTIFIQTIENANKWKRTLEKEKELGMILETDSLDYEVKYLGLNKNLLEIEEHLLQIESQLKNLMGIRFQDTIHIAEEDTSLFQLCNEKEDDSELIFFSAINNCNEYKKLKVQLEYDEKLKSIEKSFLLPQLSFEPSILFQGDDFPLRGPKYQIAFTVSFDRNPFISFQGSQTLGVKNKAIMESTSYTQGTSKNNFIWKEQKKINDLSRLSQINSLSEYEESLKSYIENLLDQKKQLKASLKILEKEMELNEKLIHVIEKEHQLGLKKALDFLEQQIVLMENRCSIYETSVKLILINKKFDLLTLNKTGVLFNGI